MNHFDEMIRRLNKGTELEPHHGNEERVTRNLLFAIAHGVVAANERLEAILADYIAGCANAATVKEGSAK